MVGNFFIGIFWKWNFQSCDWVVAFTICAKPNAVASFAMRSFSAGMRFNARSESPTGRRLQASYVLKRPLAAHARKYMRQETPIEPRADSMPELSKIERPEAAHLRAADEERARSYRMRSP
jgi:hypothetical protein